MRLVGGGVRVADVKTRAMLGVVVRVEILGAVGVRVRSGELFLGVGVNRKTPVIATSVPFPYPSSFRISSKAAGFMGALISKDQ